MLGHSNDGCGYTQFFDLVSQFGMNKMLHINGT